MSYKYEFERESCWYKGSCNLYGTPDCNSSCIRYLEMHYLMETSGIPKARQRPEKLVPNKIDADAFYDLQDIKDDIVTFVENGENLYIYSESFGNGKTTWGLKMLMKYFDEVWAGNGFKTRGIFIHVPTLLTKIKDGFTQKDEDFEMLRNNLAEVDLVVWDDIGSTNISNFDHTTLLTYIDQRVLSGKSNIYTGNLHGQDLPSAIGNRLASRVWNASIQVELLDEKDHRGGRYK